MKFEIKDIGIDGIEVRRSLDDAATRRLLQPESMELVDDPPAHAELNLRLYPAEDTVMVQGSVVGQFTVPCSRCLGPCVVRVDEPNLTLTFFPSSTDAADDEELSADDLDTSFHDGETVNLAPIVRENMLLAIPISPVCRESCRGLCPGCGADLNETTCDCDRSSSEASPWVAALSQIKVKE